MGPAARALVLVGSVLAPRAHRGSDTSASARSVPKEGAYATAQSVLHDTPALRPDERDKRERVERPVPGDDRALLRRQSGGEGLDERAVAFAEHPPHVDRHATGAQA